MAYWTQALARHFTPHFETLHALMTWKDTAKSHAFMVACAPPAFAFLFVSWRFFALAALCFVALRGTSRRRETRDGTVQISRSRRIPSGV